MRLNLSVAHTSLLCARPNLVMCAPRELSPRALAWSCACQECCPGLIVRAPRALSSCAQALLWQLCYVPAVPCRDTTSSSRPKLSRLKCQVATWEPQALSKSIATEFLCRARNSVVRASQSRVHARPTLSWF